MRVSAVIVARNEEETIARCIESVQGQTVGVDEILLVNDGSTDRTVEIAREYPVDIYDVQYGAYYPTKRLSICAAENDVVLSLDGDTWIDGDFLEKGLDHLAGGYDAATGYVYPLERTPAGDIASFICNGLPPGLYHSGPGYVLDRRAYFRECEVHETDEGFMDICEPTSYEIPLKKLYIIKDASMRMHTELPSSGQRRMILGARALGTVITAVRLLS